MWSLCGHPLHELCVGNGRGVQLLDSPKKKKKVFKYREKLANDVLKAKPALVTEAEIEPLPNKVT